MKKIKGWAITVAWNSLIWFVIFFFSLGGLSSKGGTDFLSVIICTVFMAVVSGSIIHQYLIAKNRAIEDKTEVVKNKGEDKLPYIICFLIVVFLRGCFTTTINNNGEKIQGNLKSFYILGNNDFEGYAQLPFNGDLVGGIVGFYLKNKGKESWDFKNAVYYMVDKNDANIRLEFSSIMNTSFSATSYILIPGKMKMDFK